MNVALNGLNGFAVYSSSSNGIFYTTSGGQYWQESNVSNDSLYPVDLSGSYGIAGSSAFNGIYYTSNSGVSWSQSFIINP